MFFAVDGQVEKKKAGTVKEGVPADPMCIENKSVLRLVTYPGYAYIIAVDAWLATFFPTVCLSDALSHSVRYGSLCLQAHVPRSASLAGTSK